MPGRDDLLQQNRATVRARVESAGDQASTGGQKPVYPSHRSLLGGNLDVASALESIEFSNQGPLGDGSLRNSVAYIRYWNRPGSKSTAETSSQTIDATQLDPALDPQLQTAEELATAWYEGGELPDNTTIEYSTSLPGESDAADWYTVNTGVERDEDGNIIQGVSQTVFTSPNTDRQRALSQEIPTTRTPTDNPKAIVVADTEQIGGGGRGSRVADQQIGQVKPANPNGFVNTISRIGRNVLGIPPGQIGYSGQAGGAQGGKAALASGGTLTKGMWQFLFNPSELEIEAGPEFRTAETWGVSDKANSGQPLNWSHNKNSQLKFNSVLLNGYVFGRKVEELEQGIFELFMARDGEGQAGPPILEFVWGKRVFGPCVIKDISIKEKMWDEGMVVNAELSFTLEQIPEWTINDGYVDVARPGRIPMVYDVTESGSVGAGTTTPPGAGGNAEGDNPPSGQKPTGQNGLTPTELYKRCLRAGVYTDKFYGLLKKIRIEAGSVPSVLRRIKSEYDILFSQAKSELGNEFTSSIKNPNADPTALEKSISIIIKAEDQKGGIFKNYRPAAVAIESAINSGYTASKAIRDSSRCKQEIEKVDKVTAAQKADVYCKGRQAGVKCSNYSVAPGGRTTSCSGIGLICGADGYLKNESTYKV